MLHVTVKGSKIILSCGKPDAAKTIPFPNIKLNKAPKHKMCGGFN